MMATIVPGSRLAHEAAKLAKLATIKPTRELRLITSEVAGSSPVVPANSNQFSFQQKNFLRALACRVCVRLALLTPVAKSIVIIIRIT